MLMMEPGGDAVTHWCQKVVLVDPLTVLSQPSPQHQPVCQGVDKAARALQNSEPESWLETEKLSLFKMFKPQYNL